jgi:pilus assembly protein Flp/PilA
MTMFKRLPRSESGAVAIEYGLIAALLALGIVGALVGTRGSLNQDFNCLAGRLNGSTAASCVVPKFDPASPIGQAQAMMPSNIALSGITKAANGSSSTWATYNGNINVAMVVNGNWVWFSGTPIASGVWQVTSDTSSMDTASASGQKAYFVAIPGNLVMVNGTPS